MNQLRWFLFILIIVILDQFSKGWVVENLYLYERVKILPFFDITLLHNTGAAFSFFAFESGNQRLPLILISFVVSIFLIVVLIKDAESLKFTQKSSLALIAGGAIGNLIDRILEGYVIDFFLFYYESFYFPSFNVADSAITLGMIIFLLDNFMIKNK
tara:strand:- start:1336 stop:1806 length:471 start_codon:yes stop_codon:yes gene_type:complete